MYGNKDDLRDRFPQIVKDTGLAIDSFVCVFYWLLLEKWNNDPQIQAEALSLLEQHRPTLASDVKTRGPVTVWVKGNWNKQSSYLA